MKHLKFRHKEISTKKVKRRYRLSFYSENTLHELWSVKFTRVRIVVTSIILILALASLISTIIVSTPLRTFLPGYIKSEQRHEYIVANMRMDSLENVIALRNIYFENLNNILTDHVQVGDSSTILPTDSLQVLFVDSLMKASDLEMQFVKDFDEHEQFNIAVLTPMIAEHMVFAVPVQAQPQASGAGIELPAAVGSPVVSIYDGTVISVAHTIRDGFNVTIQHPEGFISVYKHLSAPFVTEGSKVSAAQRIATTTHKNLKFELWHNGIAVMPTDYIAF